MPRDGAIKFGELVGQVGPPSIQGPWAGDGGGDRARRPDEDMGSRQADRKRRSRASVQVVPPRARRGLVADNSPYRSPRSPATKRFQPASNLFPGPAALRSLGAGLSLRRLGCRSIGTLGSKLGSGRDPATVSRDSKRPALDRCRRRLPVDLLPRPPAGSGKPRGAASAGVCSVNLDVA